jgi:hypothetical protein
LQELYQSELVGPGGEPFNFTKNPTDLGVWRRTGFAWTLSHDQLRAQWPLARQIREFFPTFVPLGVVQEWTSPNGLKRKFFRCVIGQSKPGWMFETEAGSEARRIHVTPPVDFPSNWIQGPIVADRTLVWWPQGEEGRTPGKYVSFDMYLEAMRQAIHQRDTQSALEQHKAMLAEMAAEEAAEERSAQDYLSERRKERRRRRIPKSFVPQNYEAQRPPSRGKPSGRKARLV